MKKKHKRSEHKRKARCVWCENLGATASLIGKPVHVICQEQMQSWLDATAPAR